MRFSDSDLQTLARVMAPYYQQPEVQSVPYRPPPQTKVVEKTRVVTRQVENTEVVDHGPAIWVLAVAGVGLVIGAVLTFVLLAVGLPVLALSVAFFAIAVKRVRRTNVVTVTTEEKAEEPITVEVEEESPLEYRQEDVPNPKRVTAVGKVAVEFLVLPVPGGNLILNDDGLGLQTELKLAVPRQPKTVWDTCRALDEAYSQVPTILDRGAGAFAASQETSFGRSVVLHGTEREQRELHERLAGLLSDRTSIEFFIGHMQAGDRLIRLLESKAENGTVTPALWEGLRLLDTLHGEAGRKLDTLLRRRLDFWRVRHVAMDGARLSSLRNGIAPICHNLGQVFHYSAFRFYCPRCNEEAQEDLLNRDYAVQSGASNTSTQFSENTRCLLDLEKRVWRCSTCDHEVEHAMPMHRIMQELMLPTFDRLMEENKNERLRVYAEAEKMEREYGNASDAEIEQTFQRHREALDSMNQEVRKLEAEITGEIEAIDSLKKIMTDYDVAHSATVKKIAETHADIAKAIEQERAQSSATINAAFETERNAMIAEMSQCSRAQRLETKARDAVMLSMARNLSTINSHTERTALAAEETAHNSTTMTHQLDHIGTNTERNASASEKLVAGQQEQIRLGRESNGIQAAVAKAHGIERHAQWFNVPGHVSVAGAKIASLLTLEDGVSEAKRIQGALE